jgi:hypothetical protein
MGKFSRRLGRKNGIPVIGSEPDGGPTLQIARSAEAVLLRMKVGQGWVTATIPPDGAEALGVDMLRMVNEIRESKPIAAPEPTGDST